MKTGDASERLTIGKVAKRAGVNLETLRYYERRGILKEPRRRPSGYREYDPETIRLVRFIKRAQELGFSLKEVQQLLKLRDRPSRDRERASALAQAKMADIAKKIDDLRAMHEALQRLVDACACDRQSLECPIIEALNEAEPKTS